MIELPKRKHPRLKNYNYSQSGAYFITIATHQHAHSLSRIIPLSHDEARISLSTIGEIAEQQLLILQQKYPYLRIEQYVIMPNHIHAILRLLSTDDQQEELLRSSITDIICAYKSITTRLCNAKDLLPGRKIFQTSFF